MPNIKLQSSDGEIFEVDVEIAKMSMVIKEMLDIFGMDDEEEVIPLNHIDSATLNKVIEWATFHRLDLPQPENVDDDSKKKNRTDDISPWDAEFLQVDQGTLFSLMLAANFLDIKGLLDVACKTVANMIKDKTPEEIRKIFTIENDFPPSNEQVREENEESEEEQVREENEESEEEQVREENEESEEEQVREKREGCEEKQVREKREGCKEKQVREKREEKQVREKREGCEEEQVQRKRGVKKSKYEKKREECE